MEAGKQVLTRLEQARKTGEDGLRFMDERTREMPLITATPIIAILP